MRLIHSMVILLLVGGIVACQSNEVAPPLYFGQDQVRGLLIKENDHWYIKGCAGNNKRYQLKANTELEMDAQQLLTKPTDALFIDAIGKVTVSPTPSVDDLLEVNKLNRLTLQVARGCGELDFNKVMARSIGKNPLWVLSVALKGLVLERMDQEPLVLPYVQERLPSGQMNFSTEANGQRIELWVAPERCLDEETGEIYALRAKLTINYQTFNGCGYLGQAAGVL